MPWKETTTMSQRTEFIRQVKSEDVNFSELCRRFAISRKAGYKWLRRDRGVVALGSVSIRAHLRVFTGEIPVVVVMLPSAEMFPESAHILGHQYFFG
jgi:hypothetical protein